jgi:hypothetical protein
MSKKDDKIAQLEEMLAHTLEAFEDALALVFAEVIEHSKHHDDGPEPEELASHFAEFITRAQQENWSPHEIVHAVANTIGHSLLSQTKETLVEAGMFIVKPGQTITDVIKEQIANEDVPSELRTALQAMLDSGRIDQIEAQVRDYNKQSNAHLN